jgi:RimJ/RimL family protein N-acetyltransferase
MHCWARNLCGGGAVAVHHALTGSYRTPHEPWCEVQRAWMAAAVSAFQRLSSKGVHFERVYKTLGHRGKPSLFLLAKAVLTMTVGVRPIEEGDAPMLAQWENWNTAAYFVVNENGILLATQYDREMDSLYPKGIDQELLLVRKNGTPFGLFKVRPDRIPGTAYAWIYMHDETDYASETVRRGFRAILKEASGQQAIRRLLVPAGPGEHGLQAFLEALGFTRAGVLREALYLHDHYHDVTLFDITADAL